ncbi:MAG: hypothetical protein ASARMPREDX12_000720 [Alectoria sarmentosa]|nr:MAG: hypothetical protein ASARMPREDX12_000720 [Alectoria sarmentosa]
MVWGESIGLLSPDESRDDVLDQVEGHEVIKDALQQISTLLRGVEKLKTEYGVEVDNMNEGEHSQGIEVSRRRRDIFNQHPIVEFLGRLTTHQRKSTIITKTRSVGDSRLKKFEALVENLDRVVTKLIKIDVSHDTHVRRDMATRETARNHSEYLSSVGSVVERNDRIRDWDAQIESVKSDSQIMNLDERRRKRRRYEPLSPSRSTTRSMRRDSPPIRISRFNGPHHDTKVYIFCCQELRLQRYTREDLLSMDMLEYLVDEPANASGIPRWSVYHNAREKVIQKITGNPYFRGHYERVYGEYRHKYEPDKARAKIHVFCPPLLQYIRFALALAPPQPALRTSEFDVVIHPDDRLIDRRIYSAETVHKSLLQLCEFVRSNAKVGEPTDTVRLGVERESRCRYLAARFDQVWMDQRVAAVAADEYPRDPIDASDFFRESHEDGQIALMAIMAGPQVCDSITSIAPLVRPNHPVQELQIYKLEELADVTVKSNFRWKTRHFYWIDPPLETAEGTRPEPPGPSLRMGNSNSSSMEDVPVLPDQTLQSRY